MHLSLLTFLVPLAGFLVGLLIGLTGIGGAVLMTPFLILGLGMPPALAVGTDMAFAAVTKVAGAWQYRRQGMVNFRLVADLALGSLPGALLAIGLLAWLQNRVPYVLDGMLRHAISLILFVAAALFLMKAFGRTPTSQATGRGWNRWKVVAIGGLGGILVGLTSAGSGSVILALLTMVVPLSTPELVAADVAHAVLLLGVSALGHWGVGGVDLPTVALLLVGSIPGIVLGGRLILAIPRRWLQTGLAGVLIVAAVRIL
jgi:uncharacterized membrane protein YfcA